MRIGSCSTVERRRLTLHNEIGEISSLAGFMDSIAERMKMTPEVAANVNLALEEAVSNVVMYAYPEGEKGLVEIEADIRKTSLILKVSDSGKPFNPLSAPIADTTLGVAERQVGGLGIFLMRTIMDSVSYSRKSGRNILKMTKKI